ncbi:MAG: hypothetical protein ACTHNW_06005 [Mucilaginibacter sp.]
MFKRIVRYFLYCIAFLSFLNLQVEAQNNLKDHIYQYSVKVGSRDAYLWIPPECAHIRGVIISLANLTERQWLEDPLIRKTAADVGLGIIWVGPGAKGDKRLTADMRPGMEMVFQNMMDSLAEVSGYAELKNAPVIPMGHSANGHFAWTFANALPQRTIAAIPIKTIPLPDSLNFKDIPVCYVVGQTTEWPQYRSRDVATQPGDRDFYWPVVRKTALALRTKSADNLIGVVTDPGGGHFDWTANMAKFVALYIRKACEYRLPKSGQAQLRRINKESGWLTGSGGMKKDEHPPALYNNFKGSAADGYWFFDKETAMAAVKFEGDRVARRKQMPTFIQDGKLLNVTRIGYAPLKFESHPDGVTFDVEGGFLSMVPNELIGAGEKLGHAPGPVKFKVVNGPAVQTGAKTFRLQFDRWGMGGQIFILESKAGNKVYRYAVQPGMINIPAKLTSGSTQSITFTQIDVVKAGTKSIQLNATSTSGLPVDYYVKAGPAYIDHNRLHFTKIPPKSKFPVKVSVVAYQWGRTIAPLYQSAEPIEQAFCIRKK